MFTTSVAVVTGEGVTPVLLLVPAACCLEPDIHIPAHTQMVTTCAPRTLLCHPLDSLLEMYNLSWTGTQMLETMLLKVSIIAQRTISSSGLLQVGLLQLTHSWHCQQKTLNTPIHTELYCQASQQNQKP